MAASTPALSDHAGELRLPGRPPTIRFFAPGKAAPGGSKKGFPIRRANGTIGVSIVEMGKGNKEWRAVVSMAAQAVMIDDSPAGLETYRPPLVGPLALRVSITLPRLKGHFRANGELHKWAPTLHTSQPDSTKLLRAIEDALKGICWVDDSQICLQVVSKVYGAVPGAAVQVWTM